MADVAIEAVAVEVPATPDLHHQWDAEKMDFPENAVVVSEMGLIPDADKYSLVQACCFNTMMMFGTGPFISIPMMIASTSPPGPQAMIGYSIAALGCAMDSFIWGELGSRWPLSGASYVYLKRLYGEEKWGKLAAFLYMWQYFITAPAEVASAFIAIAQYAVYLHGNDSYLAVALPAAGLLILSVIILSCRVHDIGRVGLLLCSITVVAILFAIIGGFSHFDSANVQLPEDAFTDQSAFIWSLAAACRFGVYDFTGYYDVCRMGAEVRNPRKTIPRSCIFSCLAVLVVYFLTYMSVIGFLPWFGDEGFVAQEDQFIMGTFAEKLVGRAFAKFFVAVVCVTIFGSAFSNMCGLMYLPGAAANDGLFFECFGRRYGKHGPPWVSLLTLGVLSVAWCFFDLETAIDAMIVMLILVQFLGQSIGLLVFRFRSRHEADDPNVWKVPLFPLPVIIQAAVFAFIFCTTDNWLISGGEPLLDLSILFLIIGCVLFLLRQRWHRDWPFVPLDEQAVVSI